MQPGDVRAMLPEHPPTEPESFDAVARRPRPRRRARPHPLAAPELLRLLPGQLVYPSILGDLASAGLGVQGMSWVTSPACTEVETLMLDWMQELLGLPESFRSTSANGGGVIHGSASEATLASILAARWRVTGGDGERRRRHVQARCICNIPGALQHREGFAHRRHRHAQLRIVAHDDTFAMGPDRAGRADRRRPCRRAASPFWVCATRGTTSTMAFDPTEAIGVIARREGLWLHVDAAMSGIGALVPEQRWINDGLELADSYCTNPHKWMGVVFDCDLFYTADRAGAARRAEHPARVPALGGRRVGRGDRLPRLAGAARPAVPLAEAVVHAAHRRRRAGAGDDPPPHRAHAASWRHWVAADDRFEVVAPAPLNLLCFRLRDEDRPGDGAPTR